MGRRGSAGKGGSRRSSAQRTRRAKMFCGPCRRRGGPSRSARGSRGAQRPPPRALGPPTALSRAPEPRRAPATAEPSSARCSSSSLDCGPGQRERDGAQAPALAPAPVAARAPPLASVPRCRGSRPDLRGGFDVGLDGWVIVVSRKSAAGTALRGRTHHSTPPSPLMSSGYGTPRQPRPRPIRVHTEEVTGSIPVSPTSTNAPFRSWEEQLSIPVDEDLLGGFGLGCFVGSFDELAALERRAGADERDQVRAVDRAPAVLGGLDELERHRQPGRA